MAPNSKPHDAIADTKEIDKALNDLERTIEQLKRDYEIFFTGGTKRPPQEARTNAEKSVRKFASLQTLNNAQRFRYNSLASRFSVYTELWAKQMRLKEEGRVPGLSPLPEHKHHTVTPTQTQDPKLAQLFKNYVESKSATGESSAILKFDNFVHALSKQREQILKQYQCKDVEFYVAEENGRTKLKARMIK
jgi:hypothetical protein